MQSSAPRAEIAKLERLIEYFEPVYPAERFAATYGEIESSLRKRGTPIPLMDLLTAALVKCHGSPILTRDSSPLSECCLRRSQTTVKLLAFRIFSSSYICSEGINRRQPDDMFHS